jgi:histidine triad (HIT) family protein
LVIPKQHYVDIYDTPEELLSRVHILTKRIAVVVKAVTKADGISIVQQNGKAAAQDIFHLHVHIIPRFEGQKNIRFSDLVVVSRESLDKIAVEIRKHL